MNETTKYNDLWDELQDYDDNTVNELLAEYHAKNDKVEE